MELCWAKYQNSSHSKYLLLVILGESDDKVVCLDATTMAQEDKEYIRMHSIELDKLTVEEKINTIKEGRPELIKYYRVIFNNRLFIYKRYTINATVPSDQQSPQV